MKIRILESNFFIKSFIVLFWIILIFAFLFSPLLKRPGSEKVINILTWGSMITSDTVSRFEDETGIKVNINYYETNDELFAKLAVTKGEGYDIITVVDNGLEFFKENDLIKKIDSTKLNFFNKIDPHFYNHYFDPKYEYSIPYFWDIFGLGINKNDIDHTKDLSWGLIFNKQEMKSKISMTDDATNAVLIAAQYLFGNTENITDEKLNQIEKLLNEQKESVEIYTDVRSDYVLKVGLVPVAATQCAYLYKVIKNDKNLGFFIPKEGGFLIVDLIALPKLSQKDEYVYKFLNFLYQDKELISHFDNYGHLPVFKHLLETLDLSFIGGIKNVFDPVKFKKFEFFKTDLATDKISKIWTKIKA